MSPKITLTDYRFGLIVGACAAWGVQWLFNGAEVLVFDGLVIPWNTTNAVLAVLAGLLYIGLAYCLHGWVKSVQKVADAETER